MQDMATTLEPTAMVPRTAAIWRSLIVCLMAFLTVVDLFAAQALLPSLVHHYGVSPAAMGLAVNACTFGMAGAGLAVALFGRNLDRRRGIILSLALLSIPTVLLAHAPNLAAFAALRVTQGVFMATAFGLTLAYLGETLSGRDSAGAFAAYITGNVASNLLGRLIAAGVADHLGLSAAFYAFAMLNLAGAALAYVAINMRPVRAMCAGAQACDRSDWRVHISNPALRAGFGIGFCILFAFIGTFTFINFVLVAPPHSVGMMQLGIIYLVFLPSIVTTLFAGAASTRFGSRKALLAAFLVAAVGLPLMLSDSLTAVLVGMVLLAVGTFFAQALATAYVGRVATTDKAAASGIYLASYFIGGLVGTAVLGQIFDRFGWTATVAGIGASLAVATLLCLSLQDQTAPGAPRPDTLAKH